MKQERKGKEQMLMCLLLFLLQEAIHISEGVGWMKQCFTGIIFWMWPAHELGEDIEYQDMILTATKVFVIAYMLAD